MVAILTRYTVEFRKGNEVSTEEIKNSNHVCMFEKKLAGLLAEGYEVVRIDARKKYAKLQKGE